MSDANVGIYEGYIWKKIDESRHTYLHCTSVENYLLNLLGNVELRDILSPFINQMSNLLSKPACRLIDPISIDYNYIEVSNGYGFNISQKDS